MLEREPHLPIDVALGVNSVTSGSGSYPAYIANLRDPLSLAYQKVSEESRKSAACNKQSYDSRARQATIQVCDLVLVRNLSIRGKHKLADRWEEDPYRVVDRSLDFQFTKSRTRIVRNVFFTATFVTRSGRTSKPPQRLICDPVWSQEASVLLSLANSQNQELLQNFFQNWLNC